MGDSLNRLRRHAQMRADQAVTLARWRLARTRRPAPFDGDVRFALLTVNFASTRFLTLMLSTLVEQSSLDRVRRIVIAHHPSRDDDVEFVHALAAEVERVHVVTRRFGRSHAPGMRAAIRALDRFERTDPPERRANVLLFCDPDVVFRDPTTLEQLAAVIADGAAMAGEFRGPAHDPSIQASFLAVRRDVYARPDVVPWVSHGAPTEWLQRSVVKTGLPVAHFPSNVGGFILHRGRSSIEVLRTQAPRHAYATVAYRHPHFMGVHDGALIWAAVEARHAQLIDPANRAQLMDRLRCALDQGE